MHKHKLDDGSVLVAFELPAAVAAESVSLVGEFNDWSPAANPLARQDDGHFRTELRLPAGQRARFRYLLDGRRWENDWAADDYVPNGLGADDSVVDLTDVAAIAPLVTPDATDAATDTVTDSVTDAVTEPGADTEAAAEPTDDAPRRRPWWQLWPFFTRP
ncbi:MAG: isoamylase early set domain-containing protein [Kineosporiaceae bacterium]